MTTSQAVELIPANTFTSGQLIDIYNRSRADYMVPMPMDATHLKEYINAYDVSLEHSLVAMAGGEMLGVAMLGLREHRTWITRLGTLPNARQHGVGTALINGLLEETAKMKVDFSMLEVIKHNTPAHHLFLKLGFHEIGELLVLSRSSSSPLSAPGTAETRPLAAAETMKLLENNRGTQPWTNQSETLKNLQGISGVHARLADGSRGWLLYQRTETHLTHLIYNTEAGEPSAVALALLTYLHHTYPHLDTHFENIQAQDPHLPAFQQMGYVEEFRRIEMWRGQPPENMIAKP